MVAAGGMPTELLDAPDLLDLLLPVLRADLAWLEAYRYQPRGPLPVPVTTFAGASDQAVPPARLAGWQRHTDTEVRGHQLPGGHFFPHDALAELATLIRDDLHAGRSPAGRPPGAPASAAGSGATRSADHRAPLGDTGWSVWRDALLRGTGFPAAGLDRFAAPELAATADALVPVDPQRAVHDDRFVAAYQAAVARGSAVAAELAADPLLREAVGWQNLNALTGLDHLLPGRGTGRPSKRRERETALIRYWQRYCGKNDTIGFFGPTCWVTVDPELAEVATVRPGSGLTRRRRVHYETWALDAYAQRLADDPAIRRWLPVVVSPEIHRDGRLAYRPAQPPVSLSAAAAAALSAADGRPAVEVVAELSTAPELGLRRADDGYLLLDGLVRQGLLRWGADLPLHPDAEAVLRERIAAIGTEPERGSARRGLDRLDAARDAVAAAAGDPEALRAALGGLAETFEAVTGQPAQRRAGQTYAGRALCYEDTDRDLDVVFGRPLLDELAGPLDILLRAARWLTVALADAYGDALHELYRELAAEPGPVRLSDLWYLAQGPLWGGGDRPVDAVAAQFAARWAGLFGDTGDGPVRRSAAELAPAVAAAFPAERPGWSAGFVHSPDLQLCATDVAALRRGDYQVVLGEMHVAWPTFDCAVFTEWHPDADRLRAALAADLGPGRVRLLYPPDWPRHTGRVAHSLADADDAHLGVAPGPVAATPGHLPASGVLVTEQDGGLVATDPAGRRRPLLELFSALLAMHAVDGFKLLAPAAHTARLSIDRLVVSRETWRTTVDRSGLAAARGDAARYLAVRRWRAELGLPERVYVKIDTEIKPFFVDLTSPQFAVALCNAARGARTRAGRDVPVSVTEMLPTPDECWVPDAAGRRYFSELRLQITDAEAMDG
ncbi:lantibiotic dehydratase [Actinocatenispora thailandica]|uniref:lantibiotic dehydratase n=1 Tax=Actinocatenispora thailandica TaxID=227318 RepID=UPI0030845178